MAAGFVDFFRWLRGWWSALAITHRTLYVATSTTPAMYIAPDTTADMLITTDTIGGV